MAFPPQPPPIRHVVISSSASNQLAPGISATIIPNVMDFEHPPRRRTTTPAMSAKRWDSTGWTHPSTDPRGLRKGIEHAIELVERLGMKAWARPSPPEDEGHDYEQLRIIDYSQRMGVRLGHH